MTITDVTEQTLWSLRSNQANAEAKVENLRTKLAEQAPGTWVKTIQRTLHELAEAEAEADVYRNAVDCYRFAPDFNVHEWAFKALETGADDTWSGRGNDFQRAMYDGKREAVRRVVSIVKCWGEGL